MAVSGPTIRQVENWRWDPGGDVRVTINNESGARWVELYLPPLDNKPTHSP